MPPTTHQLHATLDVPIAAADLWAITTDPQTWPTWIEGTLEVSPATAVTGLGHRYQERNRVLGPLRASTEWEVVTWDAGRAHGHRGTGLPFLRSLTAQFEIADGATTGSTLRMSFAYVPAGRLGSLVCALVLRHRLRSSLTLLGDLVATR